MKVFRLIQDFKADFPWIVSLKIQNLIKMSDSDLQFYKDNIDHFNLIIIDIKFKDLNFLSSGF